MVGVTRWIRTNGFTEEDPADTYYNKDFSVKAVKENPEPIAKAPQKEIPTKLTVNLEVFLDASNGGDAVKSVTDALILLAMDSFQSQERAAKALGITARTIRTRLKSISTETHPTSS